MKEREDIRSTEDMARFLSDIFFWLSKPENTQNIPLVIVTLLYNHACVIAEQLHELQKIKQREQTERKN